MTQNELDDIPEMGQFMMFVDEAGVCHAIRNPVYQLSETDIIYDDRGEPWTIGWHGNELWKVRI